MNSDLPLSILRYLKTIPSSDRAMAYLCVDRENLIIDSGGDLERCCIPSLNSVNPVDEQLVFLAELLPIEEKSVFIANTCTAQDIILDLHLFADSAGQWVLMFDNTDAGLQLQSEQQERLSSDFLQEKNNRSCGNG